MKYDPRVVFNDPIYAPERHQLALTGCGHLANTSKAASATALLKFRPLPVAYSHTDQRVRLPISVPIDIKCTVFELRACDRQTDIRSMHGQRNNAVSVKVGYLEVLGYMALAASG